MTAERADSSESLRIAIVDDDPGVRQTLEQTIRHFPGCRCVAAYASGEEAVRRLPAATVDIVLMDINMPGIDGIECVRQLKADDERLEFIMLTVYEDTDSIFLALSAGASGYLLKRAAPTELEAAIRLVQAGGSPMTSHIARKVAQSFRQPSAPTAMGQSTAKAAADEELTPRQREILEHLASGMLYKEIATALGVSYDTVNNHIRQIYRKLHIRSRSQAVAKFYASRRR
jgi:DNA-binding NarL/FixJ family response regulator